MTSTESVVLGTFDASDKMSLEAEFPFNSAGHAEFPFQSQWRLQSMRRYQWARSLVKSLGADGRDRRIPACDLEKAQPETKSMGPQLPPHVEAVRQMMRPKGTEEQASERKNGAQDASGSEKDMVGEEMCVPSQEKPAEALPQLLAAEATAAAAEGEEWGWAAAQSLLRLQPLGPLRLGLGFQQKEADRAQLVSQLSKAATNVHAEYGNSSSISSSRAQVGEQRMKGSGEVLEVNVREPLTGLRNYALDDDEGGEEVYSSTAPNSSLYDFGGATESRTRPLAADLACRASKTASLKEEERLQLARVVEAEGIVVVSDDGQSQAQDSGEERTEDIIAPHDLVDNREWAFETFCE